MKPNLAAILVLTASALCAQTSKTALFRAVIAPTAGASGATSLAVHVVQDSTGNVLSGSVDFSLNYQFPTDTTVIGLGIVNAPAGQNGSVTIATGIISASPVMATAGSGYIYQQAEVMPGDQAGLATLSGLLTHAGQYSVEVVTGNPASTLSGTLEAASLGVLMAALTGGKATGVATVLVYYTGAPYAITSAEVVMQLNYQFPSQVTFASLRIYAGQGQSGTLEIPAELMPGTLSTATGTGVLSAPGTQIDTTNLQMVEAVEGILTTPTNFSVDVDTVENPTSLLTGQLRSTDSMTFPIPDFGGAASTISLHTLRFADGSVETGTVIFDVNYRLPAGTQINSVDIDTDVVVPSVTANSSGFGNVYAAVGVSGAAGVSSLNDIVRTPENHQLDVATSATAAMSAPLAPVDTTAAVVGAILSNVEDRSITTYAPGEIVEIYGTNLAKVTTDLSGWAGNSRPQSINGVTVTVGGQFARLLYVSPDQVDAVLAFETPTGSQSLILNNGNGPSIPLAVNVASVAPALYGVVSNNANFSLVSASNPAQAGDIVLLYATGLGLTMPSLATGASVPLGPPYFYTVPVSVTIGGQAAHVYYSIASPPFVDGFYQIAVTVPAGLPSGNVSVAATAAGMSSNTISIAVK